MGVNLAVQYCDAEEGESCSKIEGYRPDLQLIFDRFQESFTKVADAEHGVGATIKCRRRDRVVSSEINSPKTAGKIGTSA